MANSSEMNLSYITSHLLVGFSETVFYYSEFNIWMALIVKILPFQEVNTCFSFPAFLPADARNAQSLVVHRNVPESAHFLQGKCLPQSLLESSPVLRTNVYEKHFDCQQTRLTEPHPGLL